MTPDAPTPTPPPAPTPPRETPEVDVGAVAADPAADRLADPARIDPARIDPARIDDVETIAADFENRLEREPGLSIEERRERLRGALAIVMTVFLGVTILLTALPLIWTHLAGTGPCPGPDPFACRTAELEQAREASAFLGQALFTPVLGVFGAVMAFYYGSQGRGG